MSVFYLPRGNVCSSWSVERVEKLLCKINSFLPVEVCSKGSLVDKANTGLTVGISLLFNESQWGKIKLKMTILLFRSNSILCTYLRKFPTKLDEDTYTQNSLVMVWTRKLSQTLTHRQPELVEYLAKFCKVINTDWRLLIPRSESWNDLIAIQVLITLMYLTDPLLWKH